MKFGIQKPIPLQEMGVKSAFRQVIKINAELKCRRPDVDWRERVMRRK